MNSPRPQAPILSVSVLCHQDGSVLLIQRGKAPYKGYWSLPGGKVEWGETMQAAAAREFLEETGLRAELSGPVEIFDSIQRDGAGNVETHFALAVFIARKPSGTAIAGDDAASAEWVPLALLDHRPTTPGTADRIRRLVGQGVETG